jgi:hypothetical protein
MWCLGSLREENGVIDSIFILGQVVCQLSSNAMKLRAAIQLADIAEYLS